MVILSGQGIDIDRWKSGGLGRSVVETGDSSSELRVLIVNQFVMSLMSDLIKTRP